MDITEVKALIFDVFGTVVDWRSSIIQHGKQFGRLHGVEADWGAFADDWRGKYAPFMNKVRHGELPWTNLDGLHRMSLEEVLSAYNITGLSDEAKSEFNLAWHNLQPWPDSVPGLYRLKHRFIIAPMSNGNVALMTNMAKNGCNAETQRIGEHRTDLPASTQQRPFRSPGDDDARSVTRCVCTATARRGRTCARCGRPRDSSRPCPVRLVARTRTIASYPPCRRTRQPERDRSARTYRRSSSSRRSVETDLRDADRD